MSMLSAKIGSEHPGSIRGSLGPEKLAQSLAVFKNQEAHRFWTIHLKTHPCFWAKRVSALETPNRPDCAVPALSHVPVKAPWLLVSLVTTSWLELQLLCLCDLIVCLTSLSLFVLL